MKQFFALPAFAPIPKKMPKERSRNPKLCTKVVENKKKKEDSRPFHKSAPMRIMTNDKMTKNY